jgi:hypothetical protein
VVSSATFLPDGPFHHTDLELEDQILALACVDAVT